MHDQPDPETEGVLTPVTPTLPAAVERPSQDAISVAAPTSELEPSEEGETSLEKEQLPPWSELSNARRMAVLEAILFASEQPVSLKELRQLLGVRSAELMRHIEAIREDLRQHHRGVTLEEVGGGYVFRTRSELAPWVRAFVRTRPPRLTRAALECLAIVAYKQPCTRADIEQVRGVESGHLLRGLLEKRLVRILGRKEDVGRPIIYGTTREFLQMFGLKDLTSLPTLRDLNALSGKTQGPEPQAGPPESVLEPLEPPPALPPTTPEPL
ncbi:MAG: SMC-Scp complex subunit ScpB [Myxococcota bacterium]